MNQALAKRQALAEQIAKAYAANPKVSAVLLAGSVARGTADAFSDIEVDIYWHDPPTAEDRQAPIATLGATPVYSEVDENEWADGIALDGVKTDTSQFLVSTIDRYITDVLERADLEVEKQIRITAFQQGKALSGVKQIEAWRAQAVAYPDALQYASLQEYFDIRPRYLLDMIAARDDVLFLHFALNGLLQRLMSSLYAINRLYLTHPYHKWLHWEISRMTYTPPDLEQRIRDILRAAPQPAVDAAHILIEDMLALVEQHVPAYDTSAARRTFYGQRHE